MVVTLEGGRHGHFADANRIVVGDEEYRLRKFPASTRRPV
jgi:hypothetical protein